MKISIGFAVNRLLFGSELRSSADIDCTMRSLILDFNLHNQHDEKLKSRIESEMESLDFVQ